MCLENSSDIPAHPRDKVEKRIQGHQTVTEFRFSVTSQHRYNVNRVGNTNSKCLAKNVPFLLDTSTEANKDKPAKLLKPNRKTQNPKPNPKPKTPKPENHLARLMACDSDRDYFTASNANFECRSHIEDYYTSENHLNLSDS